MRFQKSDFAKTEKFLKKSEILTGMSLLNFRSDLQHAIAFRSKKIKYFLYNTRAKHVGPADSSFLFETSA
jgi:hypothetical protein